MEPIQDDIETVRHGLVWNDTNAAAALDRLVAESEARVQEWRETAWAAQAERDQLKEKADYWQRQYVIESENADDFHKERDDLQLKLDLIMASDVVAERDQARADALKSVELLDRAQAILAENRDLEAECGRLTIQFNRLLDDKDALEGDRDRLLAEVDSWRLAEATALAELQVVGLERNALLAGIGALVESKREAGRNNTILGYITPDELEALTKTIEEKDPS